MSKKQNRAGLTAAAVDRFVKLQTQVNEFLLRMAAISGKSPDQVVNRFKVGMLNEQLEIANGILGNEAKPFVGFEKFDDAALPTNSDVVIVLSQYGACLEKWRSDHVAFDDNDREWFWDTVDKSVIEADPPARLKES